MRYFVILACFSSFLASAQNDFDARKLDAFLVNDLRLNLSLTSLASLAHIDLIVTVRNVFDELYENNGWSYSFVEGGTRQEFVGLYPQAPRNVLVGVVVRW